MPVLKRTVTRDHSRFRLTEPMADAQIRYGIYTVQRGESIAIPVDDIRKSHTFLDRKLWVQSEHGVHRPGAKFVKRGKSWQQSALAWARDNIHSDIPYLYYKAVLGHDLHVSKWADLSARHWHRGWANPFNPEQNDAPLDPTFNHDCDKPDCPINPASLMLSSHWGFTEEIGLCSQGKVTDAFVNVEVGALVDSAGTGEAAEFNDFNEHEVGTSSTAEDHAHTALQTSSGIALVAGTQVDSGGDPPVYTTVATITADTSETWEEHGVFSTTEDTLMDRSLTGGQAVVATDQVSYSYALTINPEP